MRYSAFPVSEWPKKKFDFNGFFFIYIENASEI